jgi:hypothetical protein
MDGMDGQKASTQRYLGPLQPTDASDNFPAQLWSEALSRRSHASLCVDRHPYTLWEAPYFRQMSMLARWCRSYGPLGSVQGLDRCDRHQVLHGMSELPVECDQRAGVELS